VPSADNHRRINDLITRAVLLGALLCGLVVVPAAEADEPVQLRQSFAGPIDFVGSGGSFRTSDVNTCTVSPTASATVPGLPAGASIVAAYLYYGASTATSGFADGTVTLNGSTVIADRTFTSAFVNGGSTFDFYGGFADITGRVAPSTSATNWTLSGLSIFTGNPHCASSAVLGGFAIVVIYEAPGEDRRVVNVFDGFQAFRGDSISLTPGNFVIPSSPVNGKQLVVSWEGDVGNSGGLNGETEEITYNGSVLPRPGDPFNAFGINPASNQFNSTISAQGITDAWGVDVDTYDLTSLLSPGQTSGNTVYSSGGDLVFLTAEIISVTNTAVSDLSVDKSHSGDFAAGAQGTWTVTVTNQGPDDEPAGLTVTDDLPAGITFVSGSGTNWSCPAAGTDPVTCTYGAVLADGATTPPLSLVVDVGAAAVPSVTNTVTVSGDNFDNVAGNDSDSDVTAVVVPDLSTSTKTVVDGNGGDIEPGDTLEFTVTLTESGGAPATGVTVTDELDDSLGLLQLVSVPAGATGSVDASGGANGTGSLQVDGIDVPANGSVDVVFTAVVDGGAAPGDAIDNTASFTGTGVSGSASIPTRVVSGSNLPASGNKPLYLDASNGIGRALPTIGSPASTFETIDNDDEATWTLVPALADDLTIDDVPFEATVYAASSGAAVGNFGRIRLIVASLVSDSGTLATDTVFEFDLTTNTSSPQALTFEFQLGAETTIPAGQTLRLVLENEETFFSNPNRDVRIFPRSAAFAANDLDGRSRVVLPALTVVNVDDVDGYDAPWPGGATGTVVSPGDTVYLRAAVSDPFGAFDVTSAAVTVADANGSPALASTAMTPVDSSGAIRTFEVAYVPTTIGPEGQWTVTVTAQEGIEGDVSDSGIGAFELGLPDFLILKSSTVVRDPVNDTSNPKRIPGAEIAYTITVSNQGRGRADAGSLDLADALPPGTVLAVNGGDPITFADGTPASGVAVTASEISFSAQPGGGAPFTATPVDADNDGFYDNVTGFRVVPTGRMDGAPTSGPVPSFDLVYRLRLE
jgi:uncharacterized repeat protein (TIGR01451 family)/fimbrial isopeptide formation D2 family protein